MLQPDIVIPDLQPITDETPSQLAHENTTTLLSPNTTNSQIDSTTTTAPLEETESTTAQVEVNETTDADLVKPEIVTGVTNHNPEPDPRPPVGVPPGLPTNPLVNTVVEFKYQLHKGIRRPNGGITGSY